MSDKWTELEKLRLKANAQGWHAISVDCAVIDELVRLARSEAVLREVVRHVADPYAGTDQIEDMKLAQVALATSDKLRGGGGSARGWGMNKFLALMMLIICCAGGVTIIGAGIGLFKMEWFP